MFLQPSLPNQSDNLLLHALIGKYAVLQLDIDLQALSQPRLQEIQHLLHGGDPLYPSFSRVNPQLLQLRQRKIPEHPPSVRGSVHLLVMAYRQVSVLRQLDIQLDSRQPFELRRLLKGQQRVLRIHQAASPVCPYFHKNLPPPSRLLLFARFLTQPPPPKPAPPAVSPSPRLPSFC